MVYLKMLFEPKNIKRRATYSKSTVMRSDNIQAYTLDTIRESCLKVRRHIDPKVFHDFQVEALSYEHYYSIFDGLSNIKVTEKEKQEAFYLLDTNQDEFIGRAAFSPRRGRTHRELPTPALLFGEKRNY